VKALATRLLCPELAKHRELLVKKLREQQQSELDLARREAEERERQLKEEKQKLEEQMLARLKATDASHQEALEGMRKQLESLRQKEEEEHRKVIAEIEEKLAAEKKAQGVKEASWLAKEEKWKKELSERDVMIAVSLFLLNKLFLH
jgi:hypothetical protein